MITRLAKPPSDGIQYATNTNPLNTEMMVIFDLGLKNLFSNYWVLPQTYTLYTIPTICTRKLKAKKRCQTLTRMTIGHWIQLTNNKMRNKNEEWWKCKIKTMEDFARVYTFYFIELDQGSICSNQYFKSGFWYEWRRVNVTSFVNHKFKSLNRFDLFDIFFVFRFGCELIMLFRI